MFENSPHVYQTEKGALARWLSGLEHRPTHQKVGLIDPQSGHMPRLQVRSLVRARTGGSQSMFLSHMSLSPSLPTPLELINISSDED